MSLTHTTVADGLGRLINDTDWDAAHQFVGSIVGGLLYKSTSGGAIAGLDSVATGSVLKSNGVGAAPVWGTLSAGDLPDLSDTYQPLDADLTQIGGLTRTRGGLIVGGALVWGLLAVGAAHAVLGSDGTDAAWVAATGTGDVVRATAPTLASTVTIGTPAGTTGAAVLRGTTSGAVTLSVADAAGTWTMKLPTAAGTSGHFLQTDGSGNTTWAAAAGGGGITIGSSTITSGTNTRILYNNAGVVGEYTVTGSGTQAVLSTAPTLTGPVTLTGAVGSSALTITGGTQTASFPALNITQTWNNGAVLFDAIVLDVTGTAFSSAGSGSGLMDLKRGGVSQFRVSATGNVSLAGTLSFGTAMQTSGTTLSILGGSAFTMGTTTIREDSAGFLAQRNGTNAQTFRLYESFTDSSNYSRLVTRAQAAADYQIYPEAGGTGTLRGLQITASGGRLGFFGTTAIAKITTGVTAEAFVANTSGIANDTATFGGYTLGQIAAALKNYGLLT